MKAIKWDVIVKGCWWVRSSSEACSSEKGWWIWGQHLSDWLLVMLHGWANTLSPSFPYLSGELSSE